MIYAEACLVLHPIADNHNSPIYVGPQDTRARRGQPLEGLVGGVAIGVRPDGNDGDVRLDGRQERVARTIFAPVMGHLQDLGLRSRGRSPGHDGRLYIG